jgi:DNA-binding response OmpR family regulator
MRHRASRLLKVMPHRVLVVEDDPTLRLVIQDNLTSEGYEVDSAADGACAIRRTQASTPDIIVLDLTLPDCDGLDLFPVLRLRGQVPTIILTARNQQAEKLAGLRLGADDYITKPFDMEELLARIRAVLRRARPGVSCLRLGAVTVDFLNKRASRGNRAIPLTHREFELLSYLAERPDMVVHRDELLRAVWGYLNTDMMTRTVDFAIARLRKKIEVDHHHPQFLRTAHGDGYCLSGVIYGAKPTVKQRS